MNIKCRQDKVGVRFNYRTDYPEKIRQAIDEYDITAIPGTSKSEETGMVRGMNAVNATHKRCEA